VNDKNPLTDYCAVGLCNPKSPANVGAVLRACGCFSADQIFYTGTRYDRAERFYTDTANRRDDIPLTRVNDLLFTDNKNSENDGIQSVCIELCEDAIPLPQFQHPERALYLFGPEDSSLSQDLINTCDHVVFIPTQGCLNISASVNVVLYDRSSKRAPALDASQNNKLIRRSRDCRNNLKAGVT